MWSQAALEEVRAVVYLCEVVVFAEVVLQTLVVPRHGEDVVRLELTHPPCTGLVSTADREPI